MTDLGSSLLALARGAIEATLGLPVSAVAESPILREPGATFVTLTRQGELRGCIGSLEAHRPLADDVRENARAAAFRDPRFPALSLQDWPKIRVEVSLLSSPQRVDVANEKELIASLQPGIDGLIFTAGHRRATFLPQVWEQLPQPTEFLARLRQKAGLPAAYWGPDVVVERYTVDKWKEAEG